MSRMAIEEIECYLAQDNVAHLVTLRNDGSPHVAPVWYQFQSGLLLVMAHSSAVKIRNIRNDARVAISVAKSSHPYRYVVVEGTAKIVDEARYELIEAISIHYRGSEDGAKFARELVEDGGTVIIEISPTRTMSWNDG